MQLRHLEYLVATVEAGSVSAAAGRVHVTQPALSRQLRHLEHDLGVELFVRGSGRLVPSRTCEALMPAVRGVLEASEHLRASARFHRAGGMVRLTVAAPVTTLTDLVSPFVAEMSPEDPLVDVRATDGLSVAEALGDGADLAIGTRRPPATFDVVSLPPLPVWAYVPPADAWAQRGVVELEELLARDLLAPPVTWAAREALELAAASLGRTLDRLAEAQNATIAQALAASGHGVALVSDDPRFGLVPLRVEVDGERLEVALVAAWDPRSVAADAVAQTARRLREWVGSRYPGSGSADR